MDCNLDFLSLCRITYIMRHYRAWYFTPIYPVTGFQEKKVEVQTFQRVEVPQLRLRDPHPSYPIDQQYVAISASMISYLRIRIEQGTILASL